MRLACAVLLLGALGAGPPQTFSAFKTAFFYAFTCNRDVYKLALGAQSQSGDSPQPTVYWEIWSAGKGATDEVESVSNLNTMPVQSVTSTPQPDGFPAASKISSIFRPCTGQSLYVWPAGAATTVNGDVIVHFADAAERPLAQP